MEKEIRDKLNNLIGKRVAKTTITKLIADTLLPLKPAKISVYDVKLNELINEEDYRIDVSLRFDEEEERFIWEDYFDCSIWYAKTKNKKNIIITEIYVDEC